MADEPVVVDGDDLVGQQEANGQEAHACRRLDGEGVAGWEVVCGCAHTCLKRPHVGWRCWFVSFD